MSRAIGPRAPFAAGNAASAWTVLLGCWGLVALSWLVWAAARIAGRLSGGTAEPFGIKFVSDVLHGRTGSAWPHTPTPADAGRPGRSSSASPSSRRSMNRERHLPTVT